MAYPTTTARVLLAEDDEILRAIMQDELEEAGFVILSCPNGSAALDRMALGDQIDVLVTDVDMPGSVDGIVLSFAAQVQRPGLPVIYATGRSLHPDEMVEGGRLLSKPYRIGALALAVAQATQGLAALSRHV